MGFRERLELRRSNAAVPHRNRFRERKTGQDGADWLAEVEAQLDAWEPGQLDPAAAFCHRIQEQGLDGPGWRDLAEILEPGELESPHARP